jgi:dTDP-4-dehydrorhamnose reductase
MKVLVTGSTGLLGKGFEETAAGSHELVGLHRREYPVRDTRMRHLIGDAADEKAMLSLFEKERFDAVVHAAGMAAVDQVEQHPAEGRASNCGGTRAVARAAKAVGAYLVYVSTNAVFDGKSAPYAENARTAPLHHYGRIKLECETIAAEAGAHAVARPILMYGWNHMVNRPNPVTWIYEKLLRGERLSLVDDVWENPLYNRQCGRALWAMLEKRPAGVFHLAGGTRLNRHELGLKVAEAFGLDASLIGRVDSSAFPAIAPRPKDTTFDTGRMQRDLGVRALTIEEGLADMKATMGVGL